jgi:hypothetical protein
MGLIKTRPKIRVRLPRVVQPGSACDVEITLSAKRSVPISSLVVRLLGTESVLHNGSSVTTELVSLVAKLAGERRVEPGQSVFKARFRLPPDLPPSFSFLSVTTAYVLDVRADIAWWPDAHAQFVVHVEEPPAELPHERRPIVYSSNPKGPRGREPYLELSLADSVVASGGALAGVVALGNVAHNDYREVKLSLVPVLTLNAQGKTQQAHIFRIEAYLQLNRPREGQSFPFTMQIPEVPPSAARRRWQLDWRLVVHAVCRFGRDVAFEVPLTLVAAGLRPALAMPADAPVLGSARTDAIWRQVAAEHGLELDGSAMVGRAGQTSLRIWREHRGRRGLALLARLQYPSLELHLDGGLLGGFRRLIGQEHPPGDSDWERRHYVAGRELVQIQAAWRALFGALAESGSLAAIALADLSDDELLLELDDPGQSKPPLRALCAVALSVARALPAARAAIPAPAAADVQAWRELADSLDGELELARMVVSCAIDGQRGEIASEWEAHGGVRHTRVSLRANPAIDERLQHLPAAQKLIDELGGQVRELTLSSTELTALLPPMLADPAPARQVLLGLSELAHVLRARAGAYR